MDIPLEFVVEGMPVSQQSSSRIRSWRDRVRRASQDAIGDAPPIVQDATVSITFFIHSGDRNVPDVDNVAKPILDEIKGVAFEDDSLVSDMICRRRYLDPKVEIRGASPLVVRTLANDEPFVHVLISKTESWEL